MSDSEVSFPLCIDTKGERVDAEPADSNEEKRGNAEEALQKPEGSSRQKSTFHKNDSEEVIKRRVFVGQIPKSYSESDIRDIFRSYQVESANVMADPVSKLSRGCGFVLFKTEEEANEAIAKMHKALTLPGMQNPIQVKPAGISVQLKLFVSGLDKLTTEIELRQVFERFGPLEDIFIMRDAEGACKGVAFVKFETHEDAERAASALNNTEIFENSNFKVSVRFADTPKQRMTRKLLKRPLEEPANPVSTSNAHQFMHPFPFMAHQYPAGYPIQMPIPDARSFSPLADSRMPGHNMTMPMHAAMPYPPFMPHQSSKSMLISDYPINPSFQYAYLPPSAVSASMPMPFVSTGAGKKMKFNSKPNKVLYVTGIPTTFSDNDLFCLFCQYGTVSAAKVCSDNDVSRTTAYGFVTFDTLDSAAFALQQLDGFVVGDRPIKVSFKRASTTKPR